MANSTLADFRAYLAANAAIIALVEDRIVQVPIHEGCELPYIAFARTGEQTGDLCLDDSASNGLVWTYFDVACRSDDQEEADEIARAVKAAMIGHRGTMGSRTVKCCDATDCENDYELFPPGADENEETVTVRVEVIHGGL